MKTILITVLEGIEGKNILRTDILSTLLRHPDIRVVLLVKDAARKAYHERELQDPRIRYEVARPLTVIGPDALFVRLKFLLLRTRTTILRRRMRYDEEEGNAIFYFLGWIFQYALARRPIIRLARFLDSILVRSATYAHVFETHHPDLVLGANLFDEPEVHLLREARTRGIKTIGIINSWDKATSRGILRLLPDHLIAFNHHIKDDLIRYQAVTPEKIFVSGIPQYDRYISFVPESHEVFFKRLGIDPASRLIVYSPIGSVCGTADWDVIDMLERQCAAGAYGDGVELLVRFPPNDFPNQDEMKKRPWLRYQQPGVRFSERRGIGIDWDMTYAEIDELANTLAHLSVLVCYASSISVDAAMMDKPVINIDFELRPRDKKVKSPVQFYGQTHYEKALVTGGIHLSKTEDDVALWVKKYLADPGLDRTGRQRLAAEQCAFLDGKSGQRIGRHILDFLSG